jgi:hypothetical protein
MTCVCGGCGATLLRNVHYKQVQNLVDKCGCDSFNEVPVPHRPA